MKQLTPENLSDILIETTTELDSAQDEHRKRSLEWVQAENAYRLAKAKAFVAAPPELYKTEAAKKAYVDIECERERVACHTAECLKDSALEALRTLRAQLNAFQTVAGLMKTEIEMAGQARSGKYSRD